MKKIILGFLALVVITLVGGMAWVYFNLNSVVKQGVETVGPKLTKVDVRLDSANLLPFSGSGSLNGLFIGNPQGFSTPSAFEMGSIDVEVDLSTLTQETIIIKKIHINSPVITLEKGLSSDNLSTIMKNVQDAVGGGSDEAKSGEASKRKVIIREVVVKDAKINFSLTALGGKSLPLVLPEVRLTNLGESNTQNGVTIAQAVSEILSAIISQVGNVIEKSGDLIKQTFGTAVEGLKNVGEGLKDAGKAAGESIKGAADGIKGLFK